MKAWINHFTNQADLFELNSFHRFSYAKRLMRDGAKLFVDHESKSVTWTELQSELKAEFGRKANSAVIHRKLRERRKRKEETATQYLYAMMTLAAQAEVDDTAVISYVVGGLPGSIELKASMYEANSISELKRKLENYEMLLEKQQNMRCTRQKDNKSRPIQSRQRTRGLKCFRCGSVIRECPSGAMTESKRINCITRVDLKTRKWVKINGISFYALVDTGSDYYTVIREDLVRRVDCVLESLRHGNENMDIDEQDWYSCDCLEEIYESPVAAARHIILHVVQAFLTMLFIPGAGQVMRCEFCHETFDGTEPTMRILEALYYHHWGKHIAPENDDSSPSSSE